MEKKYQVFVSSTYEDLKEERSAVISALLKAKCIPVCMEYFTASSKPQWEVIEKFIPQCDYYIIISAGRYGSIEPSSGLSYTEKEYRLAKMTKIPILGFVHENIGQLIGDKIDSDRTKISAFHNELKEGKLIEFWKNKDDLASKVTSAINNAIIETPRTGWIRANEFGNIKNTEIDSSPFFNSVANLHLVNKDDWDFLNDPNESSIQIINIQWGDILNKICTILSQPLTEDQIKDEINKHWKGILKEDIRKILNTFISKDYLEFKSVDMREFGYYSMYSVTTIGKKALSKWLEKENTEMSLRDTRTIKLLIDNFSTRLMDEYFRDGPEYISNDLLTSFNIWNEIRSESSFIIYNEEFKIIFESFWRNWEEAMKHYQWYSSTNSKPLKYKFYSLINDRFTSTEDEQNFNYLVNNLLELQRTYTDFIKYIKEICKIDVVLTSESFENSLNNKKS